MLGGLEAGIHFWNYPRTLRSETTEDLFYRRIFDIDEQKNLTSHIALKGGFYIALL